MAKSQPFYLRIIGRQGAATKAEIQNAVSGLADIKRIEPHSRGGWSVWLADTPDAKRLGDALDAAGLNIAI